jgi:hypothetical protein
MKKMTNYIGGNHSLDLFLRTTTLEVKIRVTYYSKSYELSIYGAVESWLHP